MLELNIVYKTVIYYRINHKFTYLIIS